MRRPATPTFGASHHERRAQHLRQRCRRQRCGRPEVGCRKHPCSPHSTPSHGGLLADNGGSTKTIALLDDPANPALGGALAIAGLDTDQRGETRPAPAGTNPDIGAFELAQG